MENNKEFAWLISFLFVTVILAGIVTLATGCVTKPKPTAIEKIVVTPEPETVINLPDQEKTYIAAWPDQTWTYVLAQGLDEFGKRMMAMKDFKDSSEWCPQFKTFNHEQKKQVFITLISEMARYESSFNPRTKYTEGFYDSKGRKVISQGLLQISQESANQKAYGCEITHPDMLLHPGVNLLCGVRILDHWLSKDGVIGSGTKGGARYWSVLRDSSKSQPKIKKALKQMCASL